LKWENPLPGLVSTYIDVFNNIYLNQPKYFPPSIQQTNVKATKSTESDWDQICQFDHFLTLMNKCYFIWSFFDVNEQMLLYPIPREWVQNIVILYSYHLHIHMWSEDHNTVTHAEEKK
jgi:hypothetical protein